MKSTEIVVPRASWSDVLSGGLENSFIPDVLRLRKSRKKPATMHLQSPSLLSKEWGEVQHAELVQMKSDYLTRIAIMQQRVTADTVHVESTRFAVRKLPESEDKYQTIETMPAIKGNMKALSESLAKLKGNVEALDTRKHNKSKVLLAYQALSENIKSTEDRISELESAIIALVTLTHTHVEEIRDDREKDMA